MPIANKQNRRTRQGERQVMGLDDFSEADIAAIAASNAPAAASDLENGPAQGFSPPQGSSSASRYMRDSG